MFSNRPQTCATLVEIVGISVSRSGSIAQVIGAGCITLVNLYYSNLEEYDHRYLDATVKYTYTQVNLAYALVFHQLIIFV